MVLYSMLIISYLLGSLSFAIIVSKIMKMDDPRNYGSHNAGATNVMRSGNKKAALFTLLGDLFKGLLVVLIARFITRGIDGGDAIVGICGVMAVIGHIYPIFFKFKGGKGVATAIGVILGFSPLLALLLALTWIIVFKVSKVSSLAAILATLLSPLYAYILMGNSSYFGATTIIAFFVVYKHKDNIIRLIRGTETNFKRNSTQQDDASQETDIKQEVTSEDTSQVKTHTHKEIEHDGIKKPNYYTVLGVARSASQDEILVAYHQLTRQGRQSLESEESDDHSIRTTEYSLELIQEAFATLNDPLQREIYDKGLNTHFGESLSND